MHARAGTLTALGAACHFVWAHLSIFLIFRERFSRTYIKESELSAFVEMSVYMREKSTRLALYAHAVFILEQ